MKKLFTLAVAFVAFATTSCSSPAEDIIEETTNNTEVSTLSQANKDLKGKWESKFTTPNHIYKTVFEFIPSSTNGGTLKIYYYTDNELYKESSMAYTLTDKSIILDKTEYLVDWEEDSFTFYWLDDEEDTFWRVK